MGLPRCIKRLQSFIDTQDIEKSNALAPCLLPNRQTGSYLECRLPDDKLAIGTTGNHQGGIDGIDVEAY